MPFLRSTESFCRTLKGNQIIGRNTILDLNDFTFEEFAEFTAKIAVYLDNLVLTSRLADMTVAAFPDFKITDSESQKLARITNQELTSDTLLIPIEISKDGGTTFTEIGRPGIMNRGREVQLPLLVPYLVQGNVAKLLSPTDIIAINPSVVNNSGNAITWTNNSYLTLHGEIRIEITLIEKYANTYVSANYTTPQTIPAKANRVYLMIQNLSGDGTDIKVNFSGTGTGEFIVNPLASMEIPRPPKTAITISAVDDSTQPFSILEGLSYA